MRIKVKTQKLWKLKMEQWRAMEQWRVVDAHSGGVEAQNGAEGTGSGFRSASDPGICIKEKRKIRIRISINVKRIRNTVWTKSKNRKKNG
jgi:hypothetical protein